MVCLNFFIATANQQLQEANAEMAPHLAKVFAAMLPLGGIVYIPLIGSITDHLGPTKGFVVLWACFLAAAAFFGVYLTTGVPVAAYAAFALFVLCRPLFYTLAAAFTAEVFGIATFGKVYGLLFTCAGIANFAIQPLTLLADR
eukprot:CAMPEP_0180808726 /NCGR_PEP_ID=MMETSP1038_2-20121128/63946_1 /TAXON_ID=632150 /ORGANISM="Azadinium spinosum, Strain 3D9" /LENGTH=142 /DNA_ID=CAMNT_0022849851 /DNA_START=50 /DNA_END=474 /DNA_ORIENTATION=+